MPPIDESALRIKIVAAAKRLFDRGLVAGAEGNVSMRLDNTWLLVTPAGRDKGTLSAAQIVKVPVVPTPNTARDESDRLRNGVNGDNSLRASSEVEMHRLIYQTRSDVRAVVHAHPPVATGFATAGRTIPANILPEIPAVVGAIALVPYARPGTPALGESMRPALKNHEVFLLANHGVTSVGESIESALHRMESVEQAARSIFVAHVLGGANELPVDEVTALNAARLATQITNTLFTDTVPSAHLDQD